MNIFATDTCPVNSAIYLDDVRVNKMIVETAQLLSFAVWYHMPLPYEAEQAPGFYKAKANGVPLAYVKHPCSLWARHSRDNYLWLIDHGLALSTVYTLLHNREHKSHAIIQNAFNHRHVIPPGSRTGFANCTPYKEDNLDIIGKYRKLMIHKWKNLDTRPPTWRRRQPPSWIEGD